MAIVDAELKQYRAAVVNDTSSNGGRLSATELATGVKNNVWPDVPETERTAGSQKFRKVLWKVANAAGTVLQNARVWLSSITPGDDFVRFFAGTQRNTQGDLTGSEQRYGAGTLDSDISSGANTLDVLTEDGTDPIFVADGTLWISDGTNTEFATIASGNSVVYAGDVATITLAGNTTNGYAAATPTVVASVLEAGNVSASVDNYAPSTASGTFDDTGNPIVPHGIGTVEETWTLTFSSASDFSVVGDTVGSVGSGNISSDFAPTNADFSVEYFTLPSAAWGGTWASAETLVFQTHPATVPLWLERTVPAGAGSLAANEYTCLIDGESA